MTTLRNLLHLLQLGRFLTHRRRHMKLLMNLNHLADLFTGFLRSYQLNKSISMIEQHLGLSL